MKRARFVYNCRDCGRSFDGPISCPSDAADLELGLRAEDRDIETHLHDGTHGVISPGAGRYIGDIVGYYLYEDEDSPIAASAGAVHRE